MRYEIDDSFQSVVRLEFSESFVEMTVFDSGGNEANASMSVDEFKEFRRAVGYVWTDVEQGQA